MFEQAQPPVTGVVVYTALFYISGHLAICQLLVNYPFIDVNPKNSKQQTPLHVAVECGRQPIVSMLVAVSGIQVPGLSKAIKHNTFCGIANQKIFLVCSSLYPSVKMGMKVKLHLFVDDIDT